MNLTIVAGLHVRWDGVWQRPHHVLSRLSQRVPVIAIEEPFWIEGREETEEIRREGALTLVRPIRRFGAPKLDARTIARAGSLLDGSKPLVWLYQPLMLELADAMGCPVVYDCMDDLAAFAFAPPEMQDCEAALLERATRVFCGGRTMYESRKRYGEKVILLASGVEFEFFASAQRLAPNPLVEVLPHPRWGYIGVIDERLDYQLLDALAAAPQKPSIVMVGPLAKVDAAILPRQPNVHFTGQLPYATLPSVLAGLDVALMPFALNASTRSISPTKTLEYLAAGVAVVSTPISDVVADYGDVVSIAENARFVEACARARPAIAGPRVAREHGWDAVVARMWEEISRG